MAGGSKGFGSRDVTDEMDDILEQSANHGLVYTCEEVKIGQLHKGDHVAVKHKYFLFFSYYHHGIFLGHEDGVIDFGGHGGSARKIAQVDLNDFMHKSTLLRITYPTGTCLAPEVTVNLAKEVLQQPDMWGEYDLMKNNCEHFAIKCKTGKMVSTQVLREINTCIKNPVKRILLRKSWSLFRFS